MEVEMKKLLGTFTEHQLSIIVAVYNYIKESNKYVHSFVATNTEGFECNGFIDFHIIASEHVERNPSYISICLSSEKVYTTNLTMHDVRLINERIEGIS